MGFNLLIFLLHLRRVFSVFFPTSPVFVTQLPAPSRLEWTWLELRLPALHRPLSGSVLMTGSTEGGGGETVVLIFKLCHCPPEQTKWKREGRGVDGRNWWVREDQWSDSKCTITLVFRFGPKQRSFWTHLLFFVLFLLFSFFFFFFFFCFCVELSPIETHSCHASLLFPV